VKERTAARGGEAIRPVDEIVDLVDGEDRVIGTVRKLDTDTDPALIHREIAVLVHRGDELLWQLRSASKTVLPAVWDVACAGHVQAGEAPEHAARRELLEELGVELELVAAGRRLVSAATETYFAHVFTAHADGVRFEPDPAEVAALEWCDAAGYARWVEQGRRFAPAARALAEEFWEMRGSS
jgi:isopentenyldiphosphate isomerase